MGKAEAATGTVEGFKVVKLATKREKRLREMALMARLVMAFEQLSEADQLYVCSVVVRKEAAAIARREKK